MTAKEFVLSLYPDAKAFDEGLYWVIRNSDCINLSNGWIRSGRARVTEELAWEDARDNLNYEIIRKLAT